jgi:hypothetical protein
MRIRIQHFSKNAGFRLALNHCRSASLLASTYHFFFLVFRKAPEFTINELLTLDRRRSPNEIGKNPDPQRSIERRIGKHPWTRENRRWKRARHRWKRKRRQWKQERRRWTRARHRWKQERLPCHGRNRIQCLQYMRYRTNPVYLIFNMKRGRYTKGRGSESVSECGYPVRNYQVLNIN